MPLHFRYLFFVTAKHARYTPQSSISIESVLPFFSVYRTLSLLTTQLLSYYACCHNKNISSTVLLFWTLSYLSLSLCIFILFFFYHCLFAALTDFHRSFWLLCTSLRLITWERTRKSSTIPSAWLHQWFESVSLLQISCDRITNLNFLTIARNISQNTTRVAIVTQEPRTATESTVI